MTHSENKETGWRIVPDESWRPIVAEYGKRIAQIRQLDPWNQALPNKAFSDSREKYSFSSSDGPKLLSILARLRLYGGNTAFVALLVAQTIRDLWESGKFILIPLNIRFMLECWSRIHYAIDIIRKLTKTGDMEKAEEHVEQLTFGTRSEITLPWGGKSSDIKSIHINDCLRTLDDDYPDYQASYDFLSESSHPSFTENMYFMLAGPPMANWKNESYQEIMRPRLEKCFSILEACTEGIMKDFGLLGAINATISESFSKEVPDGP
jgi:hypothetical protein